MPWHLHPFFFGAVHTALSFPPTGMTHTNKTTLRTMKKRKRLMTLIGYKA
jgi:predicted acyltransferase